MSVSGALLREAILIFDPYQTVLLFQSAYAPKLKNSVQLVALFELLIPTFALLVDRGIHSTLVLDSLRSSEQLRVQADLLQVQQVERLNQRVHLL